MVSFNKFTLAAFALVIFLIIAPLFYLLGASSSSNNDRSVKPEVPLAPSSTTAAIINNSLQQQQQQYQDEIATLLQFNNELQEKIQQLENSQAEQSCTPIQILIVASPELAEYGVSGFLSVGETELCGTNMEINLGSWGPSIKAYIEDLKKELEYYKNLSGGKTSN